MKKCPFCKNEIEANSTECPICKMILIEKIPTMQAKSNYSYTPPKDNTKKENTSHSYTAPKSSYNTKDKFKLPKVNGWVISIVGSVLLSFILNHSSAPNPLPPPLPTTAENVSTSPVTSPRLPYRYLSNGTVLFSDPYSLNGLGVLTISNGSGSDAVVKLISASGRKVYSVYIRTNNSYSIKNIDDGIYRVLFSFGADWDSVQEKFIVNPSAEAFDDTFDFQTTYTEQGSKYKEYSITLNPVAGGKATTNPIDQSTFYKY